MIEDIDYASDENGEPVLTNRSTRQYDWEKGTVLKTFYEPNEAGKLEKTESCEDPADYTDYSMHAVIREKDRVVFDEAHRSFIPKIEYVQVQIPREYLDAVLDAQEERLCYKYDTRYYASPATSFPIVKA